MKILGISGSPVQDSNTDRLIKLILDNSGSSYKFIKLSKLDLHPCQACLGCAADNICKQEDDWGKLLPLIKEARALVIGGYAPYNVIDAHTKMFMERMYSLRHQHLLNQGKALVAVAVANKGSKSSSVAVKQISNFARAERMNVLGTITATGNTTCLSCGFGEECKISNVRRYYEPGADIKITDDMFTCIEEQEEVVSKAIDIAKELKAIKNRSFSN